MLSFLLKKGVGIITGIITGIIGRWRIIAFVFSLVASAYAYHAIKVSRLEKDVKEANEKSDLLKAEKEIIKQSNDAFILTQSELKQANQDCVLNNLANDKATNQALTQLEKSNNEINQKYSDLKNSKVNSICGNTIIDIELL